jgi:phosphatidylglycerol:prolipoprotein diacylglycerol transferase
MPLGFELGPLYIRFYGIILMIGALAATFFVDRQARKRGLDTDFVWDGLIWALIGGVIGARLWHIFTPTPTDIAYGLTTKYYLTHPLDAINIRMGGMGIPGAVIGGLLAIYIYARRKKEDFFMWIDLTAPGVALAQAIGRWGNFVNQELYGPPTDLPWGIFIEPQYRLPELAQYTHFHPLFLYESLWNLMNFGVLLWLGKRFKERLIKGDIFLAYVIIYPVGRFLLEFIRLDSAEWGGINANQTIMLVVAIAAGIALFVRHRIQKEVPIEDEEEENSPSLDQDSE